MNILITAATGTVGRSLAAALSDAGADVRAFVRDAAKARAILPAGIDLAVGDFADPSSLDAALAGVDRVFLAAPNHPDQVDWERNVIDGARRAGVSSLVKLSAHGAERGSPVAFWDAHARIEQHLFASGVPAVVLRPTTYATNLLGTLAGVVKDTAARISAPLASATVPTIEIAKVTLSTTPWIDARTSRTSIAEMFGYLVTRSRWNRARVAGSSCGRYRTIRILLPSTPIDVAPPLSPLNFGTHTGA